jgi:hypothetical protein
VERDEVIQQLQRLLDSPQAIAAVYVVLALIVGYALGRRNSYRAASASLQNRGEALVSEIVRANFSPPDYHLMNHVTLRLQGGTTQIDHILVSRFGVFVLETKHYKGWIFGHPDQAKWTKTIFMFRSRFQNPLHQNDRHVRAVRELLDFLPTTAIRSVVVFTGEAEFKTPIPPGVFYAHELVVYLRNMTEEAMSLNRVQFCVGRIETARLAITEETDVEHVRYVQRRHRSPV